MGDVLPVLNGHAVDDQTDDNSSGWTGWTHCGFRQRLVSTPMVFLYLNMILVEQIAWSKGKYNHRLLENWNISVPELILAQLFIHLTKS